MKSFRREMDLAWREAQSEETFRWLFDRHRNVKFGRVAFQSRFSDFLSSWVAISVINAPLWILVFYLGHRFGRMIFG